MSDEQLLIDLGVAANANMFARPCQVCSALEQMSEQASRGVMSALEGTIGARRLSEILTGNGYPTGRRAVETHRQEGHTS